MENVARGRQRLKIRAEVFDLGLALCVRAYTLATEFEGRFETHITVAADERQVEGISRFALESGYKFVHILLDVGEHGSQPMITIDGSGWLSTQLQIVLRVVSEIAQHGLTVTRMKIEADPTNREIPILDEHASNLPPQLHFEHHIKLLLQPDADLEILKNLIGLHGACLSRNARRSRADGRLERFATQRLFRVGRNTAQHSMNCLLEDLNLKGYDILDAEAEYVVFDSNQQLDAGWIDVRRVGP